jgi:integrase
MGRQPIRPWSAAEARAFLGTAKEEPLYPAFMMLLVYGLRLGEVLGLRWHDIDEHDGEVRIRQQLQRVRGQLRLCPVKTAAGRRDDLPLLPVVRDMLTLRSAVQAADRLQLGRAWEDTGLVFTTRTGRPIEPRHLLRTFWRTLLELFLWEFPLAGRAGLEPATRCLEGRFGLLCGLRSASSARLPNGRECPLWTVNRCSFWHGSGAAGPRPGGGCARITPNG